MSERAAAAGRAPRMRHVRACSVVTSGLRSARRTAIVVFWVASLGLAQPGCDDDAGGDPSDARDATDAAPDASSDLAELPDERDTEPGCPTGACCLSAADCSASGQLFDAASCACVTRVCECGVQADGFTCQPCGCGGGDGEFAPAPSCLAPGNVCDPACALPAQFRCVDDGDGGGTCYAACGADGSCAAGSICIDTGTGGADDYCQPSECTSFFDNDCLAGERCIPVGNGAHFCVVDGAGTDGEPCGVHGDCAAGLLCIGGACLAPDCDPLDGSPACNTGQTCRGFRAGDEPLPVGQCVMRCAPFTGADTCAVEGEWCRPNDQREPDGTLEGTCTDAPGGTSGKGAPCDGTSPATACATPEDGASPLICLGGTCQQLCDPQGAPVCDEAARERCVEPLRFDASGDPLAVDWGVCRTMCTPGWHPEDPGEGCAEGEICWPESPAPGLATCVPAEPGPSREGESCDPNAEVEPCDAYTLCVVTETDAAGNAIAGECTFLCDTSAVAGERGACWPGASGQQRSCVPLQGSDGQPLALGTCIESCRLDDLASFPCQPDADGNPQVCQVGALWGLAGVDLCVPLAFDAPLTEGASCGTDPELKYAFCKDNGLCLDTDDGAGITCREACSAERGPLGSAHPDCGGDLCQGFFVTTDVGVCP